MMCGIFFSCSQVGHQPPSSALLEGLKRRGPDGVDSVLQTVTLQTTVASRNSSTKMQNRNFFLTFLSTVLSLRGNFTIKQPLRDQESGSILCWNGEAWMIGNQTIQSNDADYMFNAFLKATQRPSDDAEDVLASQDHSLQGIIDLLSSITGPYAFVFHDAQHHRAFYGRDVLGRRSLLTKKYSNSSIALSSTCDPTESEDWMEVEADGIYVIDLTNNVDLSDDVDRVTRVPWVFEKSQTNLKRTLVPLIPRFPRYLRN